MIARAQLGNVALDACWWAMDRLRIAFKIPKMPTMLMLWRIYSSFEWSPYFLALTMVLNSLLRLWETGSPLSGLGLLTSNQVALWENGCCENFKGKFRDKQLNGEIFYILKKTHIIIEEWRKQYNTKRPYSELGYPAPNPKNTFPMGCRSILQ